jgi:hypothetical protein
MVPQQVSCWILTKPKSEAPENAIRPIALGRTRRDSNCVETIYSGDGLALVRPGSRRHQGRPPRYVERGPQTPTRPRVGVNYHIQVEKHFYPSSSPDSTPSHGASERQYPGGLL